MENSCFSPNASHISMSEAPSRMSMPSRMSANSRMSEAPSRLGTKSPNTSQNRAPSRQASKTESVRSRAIAPISADDADELGPLEIDLLPPMADLSAVQKTALFKQLRARARLAPKGTKCHAARSAGLGSLFESKEFVNESLEE